MTNALSKAIKIVGSQAELARLVGVRPQQIGKWLKNDVPPRRVLLVEAATEGRVMRHELRPDIYPPANN